MATIPSAARMNLIGIWLETLVYGINIIAYAGAIYVLAFCKRQRIMAHHYLMATSTLLFSLATAHIALSLVQLLQAFIDKSVIFQLDGSDLYFLSETDRIAFIKLVIYVIVVCVQDLILIWRLYAVWGSRWKIALVPVILECVHTGSAMATAVQTFHGVALFGEDVKAPVLTGWILDLIINVRVTGSIIFKLCSMFAAATFTIIVLYLNTPMELAAIAGINVVVQLATLSPMLIMVRIGLRLTHGTTGNSSLYMRSTGNTLSALRFAPAPEHSVNILRLEEIYFDASTGSYRLEEFKTTDISP